MRYKIRLYSPHDMDLIALNSSESYNLGAELKKSLVCYANGEIYTPIEYKFDEAGFNGFINNKQQLSLSLSEKKPAEAAAIKVLENIRPGYQCAFIKALFRNSSVALPLMAYSQDFCPISEQNETEKTVPEKVVPQIPVTKEKVVEKSAPKIVQPVDTVPVNPILEEKTTNPSPVPVTELETETVPEQSSIDSAEQEITDSIQNENDSKDEVFSDLGFVHEVPEPTFEEPDEVDDDGFAALFGSFGSLG